MYFSVKTPLYQSYLLPVFIFPLSYVVSTEDREVHLQQQQDMPGYGGQISWLKTLACIIKIWPLIFYIADYVYVSSFKR